MPRCARQEHIRSHCFRFFIMKSSRSTWSLLYFALSSKMTHVMTLKLHGAASSGSSPMQKSQRLARRRPLEHGQSETSMRYSPAVPFSSYPWRYICMENCVFDIRGGSDDGYVTEKLEDQPEQEHLSDLLPPSEGKHDTKGLDRMEKIAADLRAKRDDIAADVRARRDAIQADLKAKQEKLTDEVLRDRSPEAFGELSGHRSYDSTTAGLDVANRRSFFLGIRRVVLLAQVLELIVACVWQAMFPYGGVAGFVAGGSAAASPSSSWAGALGDGQGRLGLAVAAALGQAALYTILLVFFGCDRVVLRAMRLTGWEHGAAAAWTFVRALMVAGQSAKLSHAAVASWLTGMTMLCGYFGRQL